ncbi:MAG: isoprenylcysteine carboxylmethyltransferase family protein [Candidatus Acidiferrum sp.]
MNWEGFTAEVALIWASRLWMLLAGVWLVLWFGMKKAKKLEGWGEHAQHGILVILGFWLLFGNLNNWGWLNYRMLPNVPAVWLAGLLLTAFGIGISIWARLSLGANWSGMVTLKNDHELVRKGLYRWIRHPIYTGILLGMIGSAMIKGHLRGWLGLVVVFAGFYFKARREERFLREEFGLSFDEHSRQTGMFLPKWT